MRIKAVAEELVGLGTVALTNRAYGAEEGPAGEADAEGDEGFLSEATGYLLPALFVIEIAGCGSVGSGEWGEGEALRIIIEGGGDGCIGHAEMLWSGSWISE